MELARNHEMADEDDDPFIQLCISLHNSGTIDLVTVVCQPTFASLAGHAFFTAQHFYCEAIPQLDTDAMALMECCRILIEQAGADGAATQPNGAFRTWCQNNPDEGSMVVREARAGDELAQRFVTFALQAANDIDSAIDFVQSYVDDRRVFGITALSGMTYADTTAAHKALTVLEAFVVDIGDDLVRSNALLAAFDVLKQQNDALIATRLIMAAARDPGPGTLHGLARIIWLHNSLLNDQALRTAFLALELVNTEHIGTLRTLDMALRCLLGTKSEALALDFLTVKLRSGSQPVKNFEMTAHELTSGAPQRLYELIVRWFLSGSIALCRNVNDLVGTNEEHAFDTTVQPLGLTSMQQIFLCRKAIGFLFLKPVVCCSIIVSVLRAGDKDVEPAATELLFDPILLNYSGDAKEYLKRIPATDSAYSPVQNVLAKDAEFYATLNATRTIKELHPSDYQRNVIRERMHDEMQVIRKMAESNSIFFDLTHRSTILYGKRSFTYVVDQDGTQRAVAIDLKSFSTSFEVPRREILDPVGLDYMLRVFQMEKFK
ncbi:MAG: hypothetical protein FJX45_10805 [Alphaproteobacteria bacterium]|nr:hypothetical protein [Alphaproteobacteria bacterium]MBM3652993.1 hypothetical protein [Alphaproteobacteria bacterium]